MAAFGRNVAAPLLFLNLIMYLNVIGFTSWCLNHFINGQSPHPGLVGTGATFYLLVFAILVGVIIETSKLSGAYHLRSWRHDTLSSAASSALIAWAITVLAFGFTSSISAKEECVTSYWQLWIWIHAAGFEEGFEALRTACQKPKKNEPIHHLSECSYSTACTSSEVEKPFVANAENFPSNSVMSMTIIDPRDFHPRKSYADLECSRKQIDLLENDTLESWSNSKKAVHL